MPLEATMRRRGTRVATTYAGGDGAPVSAIDRRRTLDTGVTQQIGFYNRAAFGY